MVIVIVHVIFLILPVFLFQLLLLLLKRLIGLIQVCFILSLPPVLHLLHLLHFLVLSRNYHQLPEHFLDYHKLVLVLLPVLPRPLSFSNCNYYILDSLHQLGIHQN